MKFRDMMTITRYCVEGRKPDGTEPPLMLQTSNEGMVLFEFTPRRKVLHAFIDPMTTVEKRPGCDRYLFKAGTKPLWTLIVYDVGNGKTYRIGCRSEGHARTIDRWCKRWREKRGLPAS